jgi:acetolactate synthase-1/2/3 large subunit
VFAVGASLNDYTTDKGRVFPDAAIVQCDTDPTAPSAATRPALALIGDGRGAVRAVIDEWRRRGLPTRPAPSPAPTAAEIRAAALEVDLGHDPARGLDPRDVYVALEDALPADRVVVTDNGRWIGTLPSLVGARDARSWLIGNSYGSVGQGLGNAIGAAAAHPGRTVVLFCGDGGFMMAAQALDAVRINGLDLMVVVLNDEQYGSEAKYVDRYGLPRDVIEQGLPDIPTLALALGGRGLVVRSRADLDELPMRPAGLTILDVRVDPEVNVRAVLDAWSRAGAIGQGEYAGSTVD